MRGVSALPNTFAHESWIDECAAEARANPGNSIVTTMNACLARP